MVGKMCLARAAIRDNVSSCMVNTTAQLKEVVKHAAAEAGFELAGIAPVADFAEHRRFPGWIAEKRAGEMHYLEARDGGGNLKRASLASVAPWTRSVVVCAMNYHAIPATRSARFAFRASVSRKPEGRADAYADSVPAPLAHRAHGWISRYAWSQRDYHDVVMESLRRVETALRHAAGYELETRCYVDTGPMIERVYARYAGIGWTGKNTCTINQQIGSYLFLGVILTSVELSPDLPAPDRCGSCTRCLDACPTQAFTGPYQMDASRCISYLTIEKRGSISEDLRAGMGRQVFGCDICQDVCPWNREAPVTTLPDFQPRPKLVNPALLWLATITQEEFSRVFLGSPVKRAKRTGVRRNAVIAMGNSGNPEFIPLLRELARDPDECVADHARWAIEQLQKE